MLCDTCIYMYVCNSYDEEHLCMSISKCYNVPPSALPSFPPPSHPHVCGFTSGHKLAPAVVKD